MKKHCVAFTILLCCFLAMTLCAHADAPVNLSDISAGASYYFKNTTKLRAEVKNSYFIQQGSATDGEYGYFLVLSNTKGDCTIIQSSAKRLAWRWIMATAWPITPKPSS